MAQASAVESNMTLLISGTLRFQDFFEQHFGHRGNTAPIRFRCFIEG